MNTILDIICKIEARIGRELTDEEFEDAVTFVIGELELIMLKERDVQ